MIAYVEKGIEMHAAIRAAGHWLKQIDGAWVSSDDVAVQAIIDAFDAMTGPRAAKVAAVKSLLAAKIAAGYTSGAHVYQIDDQAQANIVAVEVMFSRGVVNAHGGYWRSKANVNVSMTEVEVKAMFLAIGQYKMDLIRNTQSIVNAIVAATDQAALDAIDINAGWPAQG